MPLTDRAIQSAKPGAKPIRLFDEKGLYLEVAPSGGKWWRFKYRFEGKEKRVSLGVYPDVPLASRIIKDEDTHKPKTIKGARERRDEARALLDKLLVGGTIVATPRPNGPGITYQAASQSQRSSSVASIFSNAFVTSSSVSAPSVPTASMPVVSGAVTLPPLQTSYQPPAAPARPQSTSRPTLYSVWQKSMSWPTENVISPSGYSPAASTAAAPFGSS